MQSSSEQKVMNAIVSAYGKKGDDSVRVSFSATSARSGGSANLVKDSVTGKTYNEVKIDSGKIPGGDASAVKLAGVVAHEGQHVADNIGRDRSIGSLEERRDTEINPCTSEAIFYKSADYIWTTQLWTPAGGSNGEGIHQATESSIRESCSRAPDSASCQ